MKTTKFLAMLLAAFALVFSFASCGDDDDEPAPSSGNNTPAVNELKIGSEKVSIRAHRIDFAGRNTVTIEFSSNDESTTLSIPIYNVKMNGNLIEPGVYPIMTENSGATDPCYRFYGQFKLVLKEDGSVKSGCYFSAGQGVGNLKIERTQDIYTISVDHLVLKYWTKTTVQGDGTQHDDEKTCTTSFKYHGRIGQ